ncbi:MAG: hypothetical protein R6X02_05680 [Enhygromyxa sp.]
MLDKTAFLEAIDYVLQDEGRITLALVSGVFQLQPGDQPLEQRFRMRDRIEAVRRIWASAEINSMALVAMLREDYEVARVWAEYVCAEVNADKLIITQAAQYGVDAARVRGTPPLRSTLALVSSVMQNMQSLGSMPAVALAVAVEWQWARAAVAQERGREAIGLEFIKAIAAHPELPQQKQHSEQVVDVAHRLASQRPDGMGLFFTLLRQHAQLFRTYFGELYMYGAADVPQQPRQQAEARPRGG